MKCGILFFAVFFSPYYFFYLCRSRNTMNQFDVEKKGSKTITSYQIQIQMFQFSMIFFSNIFQFILVTHTKKKSSPFLCGDLVFALPANIFFFHCTQFIYQQRNHVWAHQLLLYQRLNKKKSTNAGNKYYFIRFVDNFINFFYIVIDYFI